LPHALDPCRRDSSLCEGSLRLVSAVRDPEPATHESREEPVASVVGQFSQQDCSAKGAVFQVVLSTDSGDEVLQSFIDADVQVTVQSWSLRSHVSPLVTG